MGWDGGDSKIIFGIEKYQTLLHKFEVSTSLILIDFFSYSVTIGCR